jgi:hypothetical protein
MQSLPIVGDDFHRNSEPSPFIVNCMIPVVFTLFMWCEYPQHTTGCRRTDAIIRSSRLPVETYRTEDECEDAAAPFHTQGMHVWCKPSESDQK